MNWNVKCYDINSNAIEDTNIFNHAAFKEYVHKYYLKYKKANDFDTFAVKVKSELMYRFWSKAEYELVVQKQNDRIILKPWCGCRNPEEVAVDVTEDKDFDWNTFADKHIDRQIYKNEAKIDVYNQVEYRLEQFVDYCWNASPKDWRTK